MQTDVQGGHVFCVKSAYCIMYVEDREKVVAFCVFFREEFVLCGAELEVTELQYLQIQFICRSYVCLGAKNVCNSQLNCFVCELATLNVPLKVGSCVSLVLPPSTVTFLGG